MTVMEEDNEVTSCLPVETSTVVDMELVATAQDDFALAARPDAIPCFPGADVVLAEETEADTPLLLSDDREEDKVSDIPVVMTENEAIVMTEAVDAAMEPLLGPSELEVADKAKDITSAAPPPRPYILSLTQDSLHCIASFLTPFDWCTFGQASKAASKLCNETTRHVRLHGFRCAQEVVTAWKLGQLEDAKELAALYVASGVPIYPRSLGHSYHTILWRMGVEAKQTLEQEAERNEATGPTGAAVPADITDSTRVSSVDKFYRERLNFRTREGYDHCISYLSEKCLFWMDERENKDETRSARPVANQPQNRPAPPAARVTPQRNSSETSIARSGQVAKKDFRPKLHVRIHQHLLDQHKHDKFWINDQDGAMVTPPISLSADFFHSASRLHQAGPLDITVPEQEVPDDATSRDSYDDDDDDVSANLLRELRAAAIADNNAVEQDELNDLDNAIRMAAEALFDAQQFLIHDAVDQLRAHVLPTNTTNTIPRARLNDILSRVDLELYSSSWTVSAKKDDAEGVQEMKRHLRSRFATYKRRLESYLVQKDLASFDECIMDFWDEFFPHSAGVHYFDRQTVVPRISSLSKFLTKPSPKALGIIQCEIERVATSKGKRASMKGRFFPTYEYRLFIRHRPQSDDANRASATEEGEEPFIRRDTLLMVAKNRGRNHTEASVVPMSAAAKKGSNNYYLYMPQQSDVDAHFNEVNKLERPAKMNPNGASQIPVILSDDSYSSLLGRLQSNFIGTEFQIFTPHASKRPRRTTHEYSSFAPCSEDEIESDDGFSSDNNSTTARRPRFSRLSLRRSTSGSTPWIDSSLPVISDADAVASIRGRSSTVSSDRGPRHRRSSSCPDVPHPRHSRTNRRVANTPDWKTEEKKMFIHEEEDGCITYTANLLGSRPRIMDVCIPKIHREANQCVEWKRYLEHSDDVDEYKMLECFRQLIQRLENPNQSAMSHEVDNSDQDTDAGAQTSSEDFGLLPLQNRPPWWNVELGSFVLNFGGRVSVASVKNFQLCDRNDHDQILLQFGRIQGRHSFTMDFQHPLTAVQAFSIAISSLQSKISFA